MDSETKGMDARSIEYVLGVEDCAMMVYNYLREGTNQEQIKKALESLLVNIGTIRSNRFLEENGLLP